MWVDFSKKELSMDFLRSYFFLQNYTHTLSHSMARANLNKSKKVSNFEELNNFSSFFKKSTHIQRRIDFFEELMTAHTVLNLSFEAQFNID